MSDGHRSDSSEPSRARAGCASGRRRVAILAGLALWAAFTPPALKAQAFSATMPVSHVPAAASRLALHAPPIPDAASAPFPASREVSLTTAHVELASSRRSRTLIGAAAGFVIGAGATYLILQQGGSTSLCDRSRNQDAIDASYCRGLYALGGVVGAGVGALVGSRW